MKRLARAAFVMAVMTAPLLGAYPAFADDPGTLFTCPSSLGGLPLVKQDSHATQVDPLMHEHGSSFWCEYQTNGDPTLGEKRLTAGVIWEENAVSPEDFYCGGYGRLMSWVGSNGEEVGTLSTDRRAISSANQFTDEGGPHGIPIQPAVDLAAEMLPLAEARAAPCPGMSATGATGAGGTVGGGSAATGATGDTGTQAEPASSGGSHGAGTPLVVGGLLATAAGAAGSMLLGKGGGGGGGQVAPLADKLFSGQAALDLLHSAGMIEPVLDAAGRPIGYRPLGDLQQMLDAGSPWQPAFENPVATPDGGTATHLSGVAFQPGPDGTISSITVAVRPGGAPTSNGVAAPALQPSPEPAQPPGVSLADQLQVAGMEAVAKGIPLEAVPDPSVRPTGPSLADSVYIDSIETTAEYMGVDGPISAATPATPTASTRPPADPGSLDRWLTTPGNKTITAEDLHVLAPNLIAKGGSVKGGLYKGGHVSALIGDDGVHVTVHSSDSPNSLLDIGLPDIEVNATLSANAGRVVVGIQGPGANPIVAKAVQEHLDGLNTKLSRAGMNVDKLEIVKGAIKMEIGPAR